jgi:hypothetical protein
MELLVIVLLMIAILATPYLGRHTFDSLPLLDP